MSRSRVHLNIDRRESLFAGKGSASWRLFWDSLNSNVLSTLTLFSGNMSDGNILGMFVNSFKFRYLLWRIECRSDYCSFPSLFDWSRKLAPSFQPVILAVVITLLLTLNWKHYYLSSNPSFISSLQTVRFPSRVLSIYHCILIYP